MNSPIQNPSIPSKPAGPEICKLTPEKLAQLACMLARGGIESESAQSLVARALDIWTAAHEAFPLPSHNTSPSASISFDQFVKDKRLPARRGGNDSYVGSPQGIRRVIKNYFAWIYQNLPRLFAERSVKKEQAKKFRQQLEQKKEEILGSKEITDAQLKALEKFQKIADSKKQDPLALDELRMLLDGSDVGVANSDF
jgi:hypothetical protein